MFFSYCQVCSGIPYHYNISILQKIDSAKFLTYNIPYHLINIVLETGGAPMSP